MAVWLRSFMPGQLHSWMGGGLRSWMPGGGVLSCHALAPIPNLLQFELVLLRWHPVQQVYASRCHLGASVLHVGDIR